MTRFLIGAGGWAYFQVPGVSSLEAYCRAFNFVEVNSTFYEIPDMPQVKSWRRRVPRDFEFAVRCHRTLTHKHKLEPSHESYQVLDRMIAICKTLKANLLHLQTPPSLKLDKPELGSINSFFSSANLGGVRIVWEIRDAGKELDTDIVELMRDHNIIHCVDLSKDEEPAFHSDILYSRLFGKGEHNIYQPTDQELKKIHGKVLTTEPKTAVLSFHFVRMYKDAARFKTYHQTREFPMATRSEGIHSLEKVLSEDAQFPSNKQHLLEHQGWKLVDLTKQKRVHASELLEKLPEKTYNSIAEVINNLKSTV